MVKKILLVIFGIVLALVFIEGLFRVSSIMLDLYKNYKLKQSLETNDTIIITCIGESMTEMQYPKYLDTMLKESDIKNVKVIDEGVSAVNSNYLMNKIENKILKSYKPNIIVAMMGLMDKNDDFKKVKKIPSKLFSFFAFYKLFNINIFDKKEKQENLDEKYNEAMNYYNDKKYDDCLKILFTLDYPSHIQKNIKHSIIDALKLSGRMKEVHDYVLKNLKENIMFDLNQEMMIAEETNSLEIAKKLFPMDNKELFKTIVMNSLENVAVIKKLMKNLNMSDELNELNNIIKNVKNEDIIFNNKQLNPFSKNAINNYKKLAKICEDKGIQLIVMQYPTLSVLPYKTYLKDYKNIIFVSNEENFKYALKNNMYFDIFKDSFAGKFGHCTEYGNKLIAENLKKVLEKNNII